MENNFHRQLFLIMLFTLLVCSASSAQLFASDISVQDDSNTVISLPAPAQRVISLAPSMTELIFSLGAGDLIVGVMDHSDYPLAARQIPVVGRHDHLDMERIIQLQPDLIIAWRTGNPDAAIERLRSMGYPVYIAEPESLLSIAGQLERLGSLLAKDELAQHLAGNLRGDIASLREHYQQRDPIRVFYQVWNDPLISVGGTELISDMIQLCGGVNIFSALPPGPKISVEAVIAGDPQIILASGIDEQRPQWLADWLRWPALSATRHNHLYHLPPDLVQRHSLRALEGAHLMCEHIDKAR